MIKEGLELYAYNPLFTKSQLHKFWEENGLRTNQSKNRLYISFLEKVFRDYRLYFYAGYIYYPDWEINEPIKGKHEALVSLEVIEKIMEKEMSQPKKGKLQKLDNSSDNHPLKGMITCMGCSRKLGCYASRGNGGVYYYYACANKYCTERINVRKEVMEKEFEEFIKQMKLPKAVFKSYQSFMIERRKEKKDKQTATLPQLQGKLLSLQNEMKKIEQKVVLVSNEGLIKKLEEEWTLLNTLQDEVKNKMKNNKTSQDNFDTILKQVKPMFINPLKIWKTSNFELKQLLSMVRFGGVLYYKKNQGYRTNETTGLYYLFAISKQGNTPVVRKGGVNPNQNTLPLLEFDTIYETLLLQGKYIEAMYRLSESYGIDREE